MLEQKKSSQIFMINFLNNNREVPFSLFRKKYLKAVKSKEHLPYAVNISSVSGDGTVDSRFVNLKIVDNEDFIFFTNYNSPKSKQFHNNNQISACFFWKTTNTQIRIKAKIIKSDKLTNETYFSSRDIKKNALAISSRQSNIISSYDLVKDNYNKALTRTDLKTCPEYWGGFTFTPHEIEFWEGDKFRLNKRNLYKKQNDKWVHFILEP